MPYDLATQPADQGINGCVITIDTRTYEGRCAIVEAIARTPFSLPLQQARAKVASYLRYYRRDQRLAAKGWPTAEPLAWRKLVREAIASVRAVQANCEAAVAVKLGGGR